MLEYIQILKKCKTLHGAAQVYIAALMDWKITNKEKDTLQNIYVEYTKKIIE